MGRRRLSKALRTVGSYAVSLGSDLAGWIVIDGGADAAHLLQKNDGGSTSARAADSNSPAAEAHERVEKTLAKRLETEGSELVCCEVGIGPGTLARGWAAALASGTLWPQMTGQEMQKQGFELICLIDSVDAGTTLAVVELRDASRARASRVRGIEHALAAAIDAAGFNNQPGELEVKEEELAPPLLLHNPSHRQALWRSCCHSWRMPLEPIRAYFGDEIGNYIEAAELYIKMLMVAGVGGGALSINRWYTSGNGGAVATELYKLFINGWAITVAWGWERWERYQSRHDVEQHWEDLSRRVSGPFSEIVQVARTRANGNAKNGSSDSSPDDPTANTARIADRWQGRISIALSWAATAGMLSTVFACVIAMLNLEGLLNSPDIDAAQQVKFRRSLAVRWFLIPPIARLSTSGAVFDPDPVRGERNAVRWALANIRSFVPVLVHTIGVAALTQLYERFAEILTDTEGLSRLATRNALIIKRVCFECIDGLLPLVIIAWSRSGVLRATELRAELLTLYVTDQLRRMVCESLFPLLFKRKRDNEIAESIALAAGNSNRQPTPDLASPKDSSIAASRSRLVGTALELQTVTEHEADEYDTFDDYLEMVLQFSYITLFSHVFPLAPIISIVHNLIEQRSDL